MLIPCMWLFYLYVLKLILFALKLSFTQHLDEGKYICSGYINISKMRTQLSLFQTPKNILSFIHFGMMWFLTPNIPSHMWNFLPWPLGYLCKLVSCTQKVRFCFQEHKQHQNSKDKEKRGKKWHKATPKKAHHNSEMQFVKT